MSAAQKQPAFLAAQTTWAHCMHQADYPNADSFVGVIQQYSSTGPISTNERKEAEQDATCKQPLHLLALFESLIQQQQSPLIAENRQQLAAASTQLRTSSTAASRVIHGH